MKNLPPGFYDLLHTKKLDDKIKSLGLKEQAKWDPIEVNSLKHRLALALSKEIYNFLEDSKFLQKEDKILEYLNDFFSSENLAKHLQELNVFVLYFRPENQIQILTISKSSCSKKIRRTMLWKKKILKHVNINPVGVIGIHRPRKNRFSLMLKKLECFRPANNMAVQIGRFIYG
jgi:hypothetical protein